MKKLWICILLLFWLADTHAQGKFFTKSGKISFFSSTPLEDIEAHNRSATSVLDTESGRMEFAVLMKAFQFKKALMEQHFNENYVESHKYPKATFMGNITNLPEVDFAKDGTYQVHVAGKLTIHGVTREITAPGTISISNGKIQGTSDFIVVPEDYNISIPALVRNNIAKQIKVSVEMQYEPLNR